MKFKKSLLGRAVFPGVGVGVGGAGFTCPVVLEVARAAETGDKIKAIKSAIYEPLRQIHRCNPLLRRK